MNKILNTVTFKTRPVPIFPSYRPMLRIGQILLVLKTNCIGGRASLLKLHLFSWGLKSSKNLDYLKDYVTSNFQTKIQFVGIEPSLNRALLFAIEENLIGFDGGKYYLKEKGETLIDGIINNEDIFSIEKPILKLIGKNINETRISQLEKSWKNAKN